MTKTNTDFKTILVKLHQSKIVKFVGILFACGALAFALWVTFSWTPVSPN